MKRQLWIVGVVAAAACIAVTSQVMSQDDKKPMGGGMPDAAAMAEMMKAWQAVKDPGPQHKIFESLVGEWDTVNRMYMGGPGTPPMESRGKSTTRAILGGRFITDEYKGEMLMPDETGQPKPMPFEGMGITGYDRYRNLYQGVWVDSMGTQLLTFSGAGDPNGKSMNMYGTMDEPGMKMTGRTVRYHTRIIDHDKHIFEMYDLAAGPDYKVMEITYTRRK